MKNSNRISMTLDSIVVRSKSALASSAQNTILCDIPNGSELLLHSFVSKVIADRFIRDVDKGVVLLCLCEGLRISEVLCITSANFISMDKVFVQGKKGSFDRVVTVKYYHDALLSFCRSEHCLSNAGNRFYYYRLMKRLGIIFQSVNSSKASVTHAGRHLLADNLFQHGNDIELSQRTLGHKSVNSTKHYVEVKQHS